ncbi:stress protein [Alteromonas pelagimontana]|uniref:Stress protein n=1 Tax=Alteromonas pelagimontana TaxID=1858656 RepID=A0A6M4MHR8_9ALTE|nr:stress protein [Alteromonas pelagimontana]QJR79311.1 stress protein [Alteromonas pelagimontana]QJR82669.1 stress protein [Alteromonas pelagimontana]
MNNHEQGRPPSSSPQNNLENALAGNYTFNVKDVFVRANRIVKAQIWQLVQACAVLFVVVAVMVSILMHQYSVSDLEQLSQTRRAVIDIVVILVMAPLTTGLMMVGVNAARGRSVAPFDIFRYLSMTVVLALAQLVISILVQLGLALLVLPGLYVFVATSFTLPLIAEKRMGVTSAMLLSCRVINKYLAGFATLFLIFAALLIISLLTFGIALIWVMPLYYVTLGVLYCDLFGEESVLTTSHLPKNESTFDA